MFFALHVFAPLQVPNVTDIGLKPRIVKKVAVLGGGLMGSGIATALILSNINVLLKEINNEYLLKGIKMIEGTPRFEIPVEISFFRSIFVAIWQW